MHGDAVAVGYVHADEVAHSWHLSLTELVGWDLSHQQRVIRGGWVAVRCGTDGLPAARNKVVTQFLENDTADWLFWVDTDMGFRPDVVDRLLAVADPTERPIVGALCFAQKELTPDGMGGYACAPRPTIFDWVTDGEQQGFIGRAVYPINALVRCAGTGSACILIHRSVFERVQETAGPNWYTRAYNKTMDKTIGEDLSFCMRAVAANIPIHVYTGVRASHLKHLWLQESDFWRNATAPPAKAPTAVIVPVMRRPHNAHPFMDSLRASTGLATVYAVADVADTETADAWHQAGATVLPFDSGSWPEGGTYAEKVNHGYSLTQEPWVFLAGDDVKFHPGWLDHAQGVAGEQFHVIGTNDLANPRVTDGEHATHMLIRRSYIDQHGASWDGPKTVAHEGYGHWYVDDEIVTVAKSRQAWAMALGSIVQHMHPVWGTADTDEVYALGQSRMSADQRLFRARCKKRLKEVER